MKIVLVPLAFLLLTTAVALSCKHKTDMPAPQPPAGNDSSNGGNNGGNNGGDQPSADTTICFGRDILPIFITNCARGGCHDASSHQEGFVFTSWETITSKDFTPGDAEDSELYEKITEDDHDKRMPPPPYDPLTNEQITLIRNWIDQGAQNTTNCPPKGCDTTNFSFAAVIQPILNSHCRGCHNTNLPSAGYNYDSYQGVVAAIQSGRFLGAIKHQQGYNAMPQGGNKLQDCEIRQIEKWIASGFPDN